MNDFRYNVILVDSDLCNKMETVQFLKGMCDQLVVLTEKELRQYKQKNNWLLNFVKTLSYEEVLYITRSQTNICRMNFVCKDIACCLVHDRAYDYISVLAQHEIPNVKQLIRVKRDVRLP